jgi:hypothetical protein
MLRFDRCRVHDGPGPDPVAGHAQAFDQVVARGPVVDCGGKRFPPGEQAKQVDQTVHVVRVVLALQQARDGRGPIERLRLKRDARISVALRYGKRRQERVIVLLPPRSDETVQGEDGGLLGFRVTAFADRIRAGRVDDLDRRPARSDIDDQKHDENGAEKPETSRTAARFGKEIDLRHSISRRHRFESFREALQAYAVWIRHRPPPAARKQHSDHAPNALIYCDFF